jgi:hypothetical protein
MHVATRCEDAAVIDRRDRTATELRRGGYSSLTVCWCRRGPSVMCSGVGGVQWEGRGGINLQATPQEQEVRLRGGCYGADRPRGLGGRGAGAYRVVMRRRSLHLPAGVPSTYRAFLPFLPPMEPVLGHVNPAT